ncbi:hypothetical protein ONE63_007500 [Megalurothrips usitatus]|uniref:DUF4485 domain-containing protein n=1 Tax=Megalurothrips usitatus TaxID=439358 RepID=A0AAV7XRH0_9NEOP|nr:hypothetical protein ONE63_007500 [Megalurothrips usitatus]
MDSDQFEVAYEEQFKRYLLVAKGFVHKLRKRHDRKIAAHWIQRLVSLRLCSNTVGKDRNTFFQYFIRVLQEAVLEDMLEDLPDHLLQSFQHSPIQGFEVIEDPRWLETEINIPQILRETSEDDAPYLAHWSHDQKTYIAAKALPGKGALVYMAVSTDPSLGWSNLSD